MIHCAVCSCRDRFFVRRAPGIHFRRTRQLFFGQFQIAGTDYIPWYAGIRFAGVLGAPENGFSSWRYPRFQVIESDVTEGKLRQQAGLRGIRFLFSPGRIGFAPMWARESRNRTVSLVAYAGKHFSAANLPIPGRRGREETALVPFSRPARGPCLRIPQYPRGGSVLPHLTRHPPDCPLND